MIPNMRVSDLINQEAKDWDESLLENYVNMDGIPLIRSLAISSAHRRDTFCWNYTRNGQYTMDLGQLLLILVDVDELGWTVVGTFNLWGKKLHSARISFAFGSRSTAVGNGEHALSFGTDCKKLITMLKEPHA
ncbi:hypothetical protein F2Q70_00004507 [Brassica cretica]|uniref:Uncharacterized protein n=1 Tax=Brassica cretica TaxID=69181 RepID=A0A8S9J3C8_BRACR|nr:hypothetical protein F2Q70_00004507 [Brassica cretica]